MLSIFVKASPIVLLPFTLKVRRDTRDVYCAHARDCAGARAHIEFSINILMQTRGLFCIDDKLASLAWEVFLTSSLQSFRNQAECARAGEL